MTRALEQHEIELLAALYEDMILSGELSGVDAAYDAVEATRGITVADAVCIILNNRNLPN